MRGVKMSRYEEDFKIEAVKQVTEHGYSKNDVANRLGIAYQTLNRWLEKYAPSPKQAMESDSQKKILELEKELKRVKMERDILKKAAAYLAQESL